MTDATVTQIVTLADSIFTGIMAYATLRLNAKMAQLNHSAESAKKAAEQVKVTLAESTTSTTQKLDDISLVGITNHGLLNSAKRALLKSNMDFAERFSRAADATEEDKIIAKTARDDFEEHEKAQLRIDTNEEQAAAIKREKIQ